MPQIFQPYFVLMLKLGLLAAMLVIMAVILTWRVSTGPPVAVGAPVEQPIPFSHKHHVGNDSIDCRYCHTSVEKSSFAGLPQTEICMSCHSQLFKDAPLLAPLSQSFEIGKPLRWNRVHDLPDFVYFNHSIHPSFMAQKNPEVTVRDRGVMEKCTYCVQRISAARIEAEKDGCRIRDGEVIPACQAACPTEAIIFGDLNDPESRVRQLKSSPLNYALLAELNTRPRTTYLAKLTNPNPEIQKDAITGIPSVPSPLARQGWG